VAVGEVFVFRIRLEGENATVRPVAGTEDEERFTVSLNPELTMVRVALADAPELKVIPDGFNALVKLMTVTATMAECFTTPGPDVPLYPETVTV
jgi:DNA-binding beta-propeller fold protein YncE